jgi:putative MATE family efflux protein
MGNHAQRIGKESLLSWNKGKQARMTTDPVGQTLLRLTVPMLFGTMGMVAFNLADTFFVGQLGTRELAAMSFTFPVVLVIGSLAMGLGIGTSAVISHAIGEGNQSRVQRLTTDSLLLSALLAVFLAVVGLLTINPVFTLLGAPPDLLPLIRQYIAVWYVGVIFVLIPMVGNNAIRATGDTTTPSAIMLVVVVVNIILDPLLIFGLGPFPRMELAGAAIATVIARALTLVVALWVLAYREKMLCLTRPSLRDVLQSCREILSIGLPAAATNMITPLTIGIITSLVATYGEANVAAFGAASRIDMLALVGIMSRSMVLAPFVGQNWGAGNMARVRTAVRYSHRTALAWGAFLFVLLTMMGTSLASLFNDNPEVITTMALYLSIVPLGYGFQGMLLLSNAVLNTLRKPMHATALIGIQMIGFYIPLAYLGSLLFGLTGIFVAAATAYILSGTIAWWWLRRVLRVVQEDTPPMALEHAPVPQA